VTERERSRFDVRPDHRKGRDPILVHHVREIEMAETQGWLRMRAAGGHTEPSTVGAHKPDRAAGVRGHQVCAAPSPDHKKPRRVTIAPDQVWSWPTGTSPAVAPWSAATRLAASDAGHHDRLEEAAPYACKDIAPVVHTVEDAAITRRVAWMWPPLTIRG
jgi:hypothetical protein